MRSSAGSGRSRRLSSSPVGWPHRQDAPGAVARGAGRWNRSRSPRSLLRQPPPGWSGSCSTGPHRTGTTGDCSPRSPMGFVDANGWQIALGELARHAQNGLTEPFQSDVDTLLTSSDGALIGDFLSADGAAAIIPALTKLASDCGATGQAARPTQTGSGPTESSSPVPVDPGESRPAGWPPYEYAGPAAFDVCAVSDFPLAAPLVTPTNPAPGTAEYWAVMSAQAALRALNYGKPTGDHRRQVLRSGHRPRRLLLPDQPWRAVVRGCRKHHLAGALPCRPPLARDMPDLTVGSSVLLRRCHAL